MKYIGALLLLVSLLTACQQSDERESEGKKKRGFIIGQVLSADVQTEPVPQVNNEDAADDPAFWLHPDDTQKSIIFGTDKKGGLAAYNLAGQQVAYYPIGRTNNVDIRQGVVMGSDTLDILACTNRSKHSISVAKIGVDGVLTFYENTGLTAHTQGEVYGFCLYHSPSGELYAFLNSKAGEVEQWRLAGDAHVMTGCMVRCLAMKAQTEGMVVDDDSAMVYLGVEKKGIYKFHAEPSNTCVGHYILRSKTRRNKYIVGDIEGLAIYKQSPCEAYLLASSQGNYSYAVFDLNGDNRYLFSFRLEDGANGIDGVEETDGIELVSHYVSDDFPMGMLIVQDGYNRDASGHLLAQNFKYIDWRKIEGLLLN